MPIVAIDLSPEEAARFDTVAEREKRARKAQVHISALRGLESAEAEHAETIAMLRASLAITEESAPPVPAQLTADLVKP
jgi:hypothetical protein